MENMLYRGKDSFSYTKEDKNIILNVLNAASELRMAEREQGFAERQAAFLQRKIKDKQEVSPAKIKSSNKRVFEAVANRNSCMKSLQEANQTARDSGIPNWVILEAQEYGTIRPATPEDFFTTSFFTKEPEAADIAFFTAADKYRKIMIQTILEHFNGNKWTNEEIETVYQTELIGDPEALDADTRGAYELGTYGICVEDAIPKMPERLEQYTNTELEHLANMELHLRVKAQIPYRLTYAEHASNLPSKTPGLDIGNFPEATIKTFFCRNEKDLLDTMKLMIEQHKGEPYWIEDMGGILQQNRLSDYEMQVLKTYIPKPKEEITQER